MQFQASSRKRELTQAQSHSVTNRYNHVYEPDAPVKENRIMTPTLSNFLWSLFWGGAFLALGAGALTVISRIDRIR